jgi:hypothetical protein
MSHPAPRLAATIHPQRRKGIPPEPGLQFFKNVVIPSGKLAIPPNPVPSAYIPWRSQPLAVLVIAGRV